MGEPNVDTSTITPNYLAEVIAAKLRWMSFLQPRVADRATAEDILQSAYIRAIEHGAGLLEETVPMGWFYAILRNAVIDHFRRNASRARLANAVKSSTPESYELVLPDRPCACVHDVIDHLKPEYREAIERVDLKEQSLAAFADRQGISVNNASVRLHRARRAVTKGLKAACGACADRQCTDCTCKRTAA